MFPGIEITKEDAAIGKADVPVDETIRKGGVPTEEVKPAFPGIEIKDEKRKIQHTHRQLHTPAARKYRHRPDCACTFP